MKIKKNKYHFLFIVFIFIMLLIVSSVNAIIKYNEQKRNIYVKMNIILENKSQEIEKFIIKQEKFFWQAYNQNLFIKLLETNKQDLEYNQTLNETINYIESYLVNENLFLLTPSKILKKENSGVLTQVINTSTVSQCVNNIEAIKQNKEINKSSGEIIEYITYSGDEVVGIYNIILSPRWCLIVEINKEKMFEDFFKKIITNQLPASFL